MTDLQPEALNCPNCGAAVSSDKTLCEFCRSRLKTVACASCLGLMFEGSKFCTHCGAKTTAVKATNETAGECPRCHRHLDVLQIGALAALECTRCGGFWLDVEPFEELCLSHENQAAVLGVVNGRTPEVTDPQPIRYVPCPVCKQLMNRSNFAHASGIIIDLCKQHGVWFDSGELQKIFDFINKGGLARAREKEKLGLEEERATLREEQRKLGVLEHNLGGMSFDHDEPKRGFGGIIASLFEL
jgi:Zn-finger nucleic acid-binding protein